jgi:hypothetical protein
MPDTERQADLGQKRRKISCRTLRIVATGLVQYTARGTFMSAVRRAPVRRFAVAGGGAVGDHVCVAGTRPLIRFARARLAIAAATVLIWGVSATTAAANTLSLSDSGHLHLTSHHGFTLNEQGSASGTISGTIYIHLNVVSTNRVTAEISIYPSGGSITGSASASYRPSGATATFAGTMTVQRGTGRYAGARGTGLTFTGTVQRTNDAVTVHVSGRMST